MTKGSCAVPPVRCLAVPRARGAEPSLALSVPLQHQAPRSAPPRQDQASGGVGEGRGSFGAAEMPAWICRLLPGTVGVCITFLSEQVTHSAKISLLFLLLQVRSKPFINQETISRRQQPPHLPEVHPPPSRPSELCSKRERLRGLHSRQPLRSLHLLQGPRPASKESVRFSSLLISKL